MIPKVLPYLVVFNLFQSFFRILDRNPNIYLIWCMTKERQCLECQEPLKGRIDQKYCSDYCRNSYNNRQNADANQTVRKVNYTLRKNRRILAELNPTGKAKIHRMKLQDEGFNFDYHTNTYTTKNNKTYVFCYDQGYLRLDADYYVLVHKKEYI